MAKVLTPTLIQIFLLLSVAMLAYSDPYFLPRLREINMTVFFQGSSRGPNPNVVAVAGPRGQPTGNRTEFGNTYVYDLNVTKGPSFNSPIVGRAQGLNVYTSSTGKANTFVAFSVLYMDKRYNGSTLEIQGGATEDGRPSEIAIVSGTKKFRFAKGYAIVTAIPQPPNSRRTLLVKAVLKFYAYEA